MKATDYNELEKYVDVQYEDWQLFFAMWPRTIIGQSRVWGHCYRRRVWTYQGLELWPHGWQYATVFDILKQHD